MSIMVEFSVVPIGKGVSLSAVIAEVMNIVVESGVNYRVNPMGTVLEGDWDAVMNVVKQCHEAVMKNAERALMTIKVDDRKGKEARMERKLASVEQKLGKKLKT
jgi:uncharacterized protein (TIGR00106 family)